MGCSCCTSSIADGVITQTEHDAKVFNLQCRFKDLVASITDKWRYGIFCPEDSDIIIEIRGLLRLLICYGKETEEIPGDDSQIPEAYQDYLTFNGTDLNNDFGGIQASLPAPANVGDYFFITSPYTDQYYVLKATSGFYSGDQPLPLDLMVFVLDQGEPIIQFGDFALEVLATGNQIDLDNALTAAQGVAITSSGLSDANLLLITEKIEKLLACSQ